MLYRFEVVPSMQGAEPGAAYFEGLVRRAEQALATQQRTVVQAWSLCEYLDGVDAGDIPMNKAFYQQAVSSLGAFLASHSCQDEVNSLARKSWAAQTLKNLLDTDEQVVDLDARRRAVA